MQDRTCKNNAVQQAYEKKNSASPSLLGQEADSPAQVLADSAHHRIEAIKCSSMDQHGWIIFRRAVIPIAVHSPRSGAFGANPGVGTQTEEIIQAVLEKDLEECKDACQACIAICVRGHGNAVS
jgi:hypothetical protein